jgi:hypothetical protein
MLLYVDVALANVSRGSWRVLMARPQFKVLIFCQFGPWLSSMFDQPGFCGVGIVTQPVPWLESMVAQLGF